jgi:hypothetical protein
MVNTHFHRIVPIQSIVRPLIVDRSVEGSVALVSFEGKGPVDEPTTEATSGEEQAEITWESVVDDVDESCVQVHEYGLSIFSGPRFPFFRTNTNM